MRVFLLFTLFSGCSSLPIFNLTQSPSEIYKKLLKESDQPVSTKGEASFYIQTDNKKYHFNGIIQADEKKCVIQITSLFGLVEGLLELYSDHYTFTEKNQTKVVQNSSWKNIPLKWMIKIFLGKIPTPEKIVSQKIEQNHAVYIDEKTNTFDYAFIQKDDQIYPSHMSIQTKQDILQIEFLEIDPHTWTPKKWKIENKDTKAIIRFSPQP